MSDGPALEVDDSSGSLRARLEAVRALEGFPSVVVATAVARVVQEDANLTVRDTAKAVLARLRLP